MLSKSESFEQFQPTKPLSCKIEAFLRQYEVTDFVCNSFQDTLLFKAGIQAHVKPLGMEFIKPDFTHLNLIIKSKNVEKVNQYFEFFRQFDRASTLIGAENNVYLIHMDCSICLENITPVFEKAFSERIEKDPECLKKYQLQSKLGYNTFLFEKLKEKTATVSVSTPQQEQKNSFFSNAKRQTTHLVMLLPDENTLNNHLPARK